MLERKLSLRRAKDNAECWRGSCLLEEPKIMQNVREEAVS
jgi:hypothetical protein